MFREKEDLLFVKYTEGSFERYVDISEGERLFNVNYTDVFTWMETPTYSKENEDN